MRRTLDFRIYGGHLAEGPKIYVSNHVTSLDAYWLLSAIPEFLHFVVGPPFGVRGMAGIFNAFEQINALPEHRKSVVHEASRYLAQGECVCITPEGDVQPPFQLGHFYAGLAKTYRMSLAPIVPIALAVSPKDIRRHPRWDMRVDGRTYEARMVWRGKVRVMIGEAMSPELCHDVDEAEDNRRVTEEVRTRIAAMLNKLASEFDDCSLS